MLTTSMPHHLSQVIARNGWMHDHPAELVRSVFGRGTRRTIRKDQLVYEFGDRSKGICTVLRGALSTRIDDGESGTVIAHLLGPGAIIGAATMLVPSDRSMGLIGKTETEILFIPASALYDLAANDIRVWKFLGSISACNVLRAQEIARTLLIREPAARCRSVLARLSREFGSETEIPVTQEELADMCVLSRGAVAAILSRLEQDGYIERGYRKIRVFAH